MATTCMTLLMTASHFALSFSEEELSFGVHCRLTITTRARSRFFFSMFHRHEYFLRILRLDPRQKMRSAFLAALAAAGQW
jgi:hypothetical protein